MITHKFVSCMFLFQLLLLEKSRLRQPKHQHSPSRFILVPSSCQKKLPLKDQGNPFKIRGSWLWTAKVYQEIWWSFWQIWEPMILIDSKVVKRNKISLPLNSATNCPIQFALFEATHRAAHLMSYKNCYRLISRKSPQPTTCDRTWRLFSKKYCRCLYWTFCSLVPFSDKQHAHVQDRRCWILQLQR